MPALAVPATCCGREGGCVCAKEATCSCGKQAALHCNCEKAPTENRVDGARCSCGKDFPISLQEHRFHTIITSVEAWLIRATGQRSAGACTCSRLSAENAQVTGSSCACGKRSSGQESPSRSLLSLGDLADIFQIHATAEVQSPGSQAWRPTLPLVLRHRAAQMLLHGPVQNPRRNNHYRAEADSNNE